MSDLEKALEGRKSGGLTYEELKVMFGSDTPDAALLQRYDEDGDHVYTLDELQTAISA